MAKKRLKKDARGHNSKGKRHAERVARKKQAITTRGSDQFNDIPPGQRQRVLNAHERARWRS